MRRWMLLVVAVSFLSFLSGCKHRGSSHGICDCDVGDHCSTRAPWVRNAPPVTTKIVTPPTKLPEGKKKDL